VQVKLIRKNSPIEGYGVFAGEFIPKGTRVIEYSGRKIPKSVEDRSTSRYIFTLNNQIDVLGMNLARYINHTCETNCEAVIESNQIWIYAVRDIQEGEELSYNYGYGWDDEPWECLCSAPKCVGYILDKSAWRKVKKVRA